MTHQLSKQWSILLADTEATQQLGYRLGQVITAGSVLLLNGDLGSGKTTLIQGLGRALGITEPIASPTFTLVCEYLEGTIPLYHLDLYRLQPKEINLLYLEAYWQGDEYPPGIVAIEWAERLQHLPPDYLQVDLSIVEQPTASSHSNDPNDGYGRQAQLQSVGAKSELVLQQLMP
jgi:tRNA threonylcarbamoyladenosine biosynthesis protein TsaE